MRPKENAPVVEGDEGEDHENPRQVPQPSYPGVPFASTGSADADALLKNIMWAFRPAHTHERPGTVDPHAPEAQAPCDICSYDFNHGAQVVPVYNFGIVSAHRDCYDEWRARRGEVTR